MIASLPFSLLLLGVQQDIEVLQKYSRSSSNSVPEH